MKKITNRIILVMFLIASTFAGTVGCTKVKLAGKSTNKAKALSKATASPTTTPDVAIEETTGYAGAVIAAGGGISTGTGIRLEATIGEVGSPIIQAGTGMKVVSGVQGATLIEMTTQ